RRIKPWFFRWFNADKLHRVRLLLERLEFRDAPAAATHFDASASDPTTVGSALSISVTALDVNQATDTGYLGRVHFASSDPNAVLPADYTFTAGDNGAHTFSVTLNSAGYQTVTVTDVGNSSISGRAGTFRIAEFTVPTANSAMNAAALGADGNIWFT